MHVPDGFLDASTSLATGAIAVGAVGLCLRRAEREIAETGPALAGLTAAFVFGGQMVNFPVGAGTSGHLIGAALAAALVGPWTAVVCVTVVLLVQALLVADGGLTALGTNITLRAVVGVTVSYLVMRAVLRVLPRRERSVVPAAAIGALVSVPASALAFTALYAVGGAVAIPIGTLAGAMVGWHLVIGVGEAVITGAVLAAVLASRPDLVYLARHSTIAAPDGGRLPARPGRRVLVAGGLVTLVVAGVVSLAASSSPDGLEFVSEALGFGEAGQASATAGSPLADYGVAGIPNAALAAGLAGVIGVVLTLLVGVTASRLASRTVADAVPDDELVPSGR